MTADVLPQAQALSKANELARSSSRVMYYLKTRLAVKLAKLRATAECAPQQKAINNTNDVTVMHMKYKESESQECWLAKSTDDRLKRMLPGSFNYLDVPAVKGIQAVNQTMDPDQLSDIVMAYYIDENTQLNRGYVVNDQIVDDKNVEHKKMLEVIDGMFHSWLVSNNMAADDEGFIYHRSKTGDLTTKVNRDEVVTLLADPEKGFQKTVEKIAPNIQLTMVWAAPEPDAGLGEVPGQVAGG